jgi:hypothetical protein
MRRALPVLVALGAAAAVVQVASGEPSAAHPCTLISNKDVARIIGSGGHVEVGGSTCRLHRGKPMVGVISINPDTRARFLAFRRQSFNGSPGLAEDVGGIGERAFQVEYKRPPPHHYFFALVRGNRLVVGSFKGGFTKGQARRIAMIVARGI